MEQRQNNMRIICSPRRSGKTTSAILRAAEMDAVIICATVQMTKHVESLAKKIGVTIRTPISYNSASLRLRGMRNPVIIDDAEMVLTKLLNLSNDIDTITLSNDN
jgi:hypothetical protein